MTEQEFYEAVSKLSNAAMDFFKVGKHSPEDVTLTSINMLVYAAISIYVGAMNDRELVESEFMNVASNDVVGYLLKSPLRWKERN